MLIMLGTVDPLVKYEGTGQSLSADATVEFRQKRRIIKRDHSPGFFGIRTPRNARPIILERQNRKRPARQEMLNGDAAMGKLEFDQRNDTSLLVAPADRLDAGRLLRAKRSRGEKERAAADFGSEIRC